METIIRCSSLPHYSDCPRKSAAKLFKDELEDAGFKMTKLPTSVGAAVGTATHVGVEIALTLKQSGQTSFDAELKEMIDRSLCESIEHGILWDKTTPSKDVALKQALRQAKSVINAYPELSGIAIEEEYRADLGDDFVLSGHIDIRKGDTILDIKTGASRRANQAQYGGYSLLCRSNSVEIKKLGEIYVPRLALSRPQPEPMFVEYDVAAAENLAWDIIKTIKTDMMNFRVKKSERVWLANPNSMMCSANYCPAYKTKFCNCQKGDIK